MSKIVLEAQQVLKSTLPMARSTVEVIQGLPLQVQSR